MTSTSLDSEAFPWLSAQEITVAGIPLLALRVSYAGELGWELHVAMDRLAELYDAIHAAGAGNGLRNIGVRALNSLRLEKAYRGFGTELTERYSLDQAGLPFFASTRKQYRGRAAVDAERQDPNSLRLVYLAVQNSDNDAWGDEPVYANGKLIGAVTSGGFGFRVGQSIAFGLVDDAHAAPGTELQIKMLGEMRSATVCAEAIYDPQNLKLKG
ncbi:glycine cleavage T C-terminal barrel domain-containing protein [Mesorhizobium sp. LHD-90]|uniref:glycine cleavage T C-terminal barrel domain-containing protein n=1 Tax=Mesorhizobium sp. LHD-90 TaxID=3071414 RepID=UPI0027DFF725|nr:glycine cleavage T C-terminal barrel domain-containing protein [Mesorhizobium sp. LHD-90]MDQ6433193.1 glycine cleavage T C-terminal barrel domain-containing protein [Mesorhizobium sp. LHD-90]